MTDAQNKYGGARVRVPPPLVFLALIATGVGANRWICPVAIGLPLWPRITGATIALAGIAMVIAARVWFTRTGQSPIPWKPSPELLVQGVYRRTRNPMYLGVTLFQLGLGLAIANLWIAALAPVALVIVNFIAVRPEETYLIEKF